MPLIFNDNSQLERRRGLRKLMPQAELLLWQKLRSRQLAGLKFRRQYGVGPYIIGFYCSQHSLAIELDGDSHGTNEARLHDRARADFLRSFGINTLRFQNLDVYHHVEFVLTMIVDYVGSYSPPG